MLTKYRIVKVRFAGSRKDVFAYERTIFWFFKSYLNIGGTCSTWSTVLESYKDNYYVDSLDEARKKVQFSKEPKITITDADTKLERHLGGLE